MFTKLIRTDEHYQAAMNRIDHIFDSPAGTPEGDDAPTPSRAIRSRTPPSLDHTVEATLVASLPLRKAQETDDRGAHATVAATIRPFRGRKGRERSERGMPEATC